MIEKFFKFMFYNKFNSKTTSFFATSNLFLFFMPKIRADFPIFPSISQLFLDLETKRNIDSRDISNFYLSKI